VTVAAHEIRELAGAELAGVSRRKFEKLWPRKLRAKFIELDGKLYNFRCEKERKEAMEGSIRGNASAQVRWKQHKESKQNATKSHEEPFPRS